MFDELFMKASHIELYTKCTLILVGVITICVVVIVAEFIARWK